MRMADKLEGAVTKDIVQPLMMRSLYSIGEKDLFSCCKGVIAYESNNDFKAKKIIDALVLKVKLRDRKKK
jgi:hypothetical protein